MSVVHFYKGKGRDMKRSVVALILGLILFAPGAHAAVFSARVDSSSTNIPTTYTSAAGSKVLTGIRNVRTILVDNRSAGEIAVNCEGTATTPPAVNAQSNMYVAGTSQIAIDQAYLGGTCYIRSMTGSTISSGIVVVMLVGG